MPDRVAEQAQEMTSAQHAASLRMVRKISGMLAHPDAHKVFLHMASEELGKIVGAQLHLARSCGLTSEDLEAYGEAGAKDFEVVETTPGVFQFQLAEKD